MKNDTTTQTSETNVVPITLPPKQKRKAEDKWSPQVMQFGFTPVPNLIFRAQAKLKITPMQMNVLMHLAEHWWEADKNPYPAKTRIADRMGKSPRQIQRYLTELEKAGLIARIKRYTGRKAQTSNEYSLSGLVQKLKALVPEFEKAAMAARQRRKRLEAA
jgi:predicted transcriptional regulator